jgi:hypothetical protein
MGRGGPAQPDRRGQRRDAALPPRGDPCIGLCLGEIFHLDELAAHCAADGRYAFLLVAPPLPVTRAVGTPINPYAIK